MKILITNWLLSGRTGSELYASEIATALKARGHQVAIYAVSAGRLARQTRTAGIEVVSDIRQLTFRPDIIHGQQQGAIADAMLALPSVPAICVVHNATSQDDEPIVSPRIRRYIGVDRRCLNRIAANPAIPPEQQVLLHNFVDVSRFAQRPALPARAKRALVFSNYADRETHLPAVWEACTRHGLALDVLGERAGTQSDQPELILGWYDIVFAKARCAIEAMATGAAVILCDFAGLGEMVMPDNYDELRDWNFGAGKLRYPLDADLIATEIERYDPEASRAVSNRIRTEASLAEAAAKWEALYQAVLAEHEDDPAAAGTDAETWMQIQRRWRCEKKRLPLLRLATGIRRLPLGNEAYFLARRARRRIQQVSGQCER